MARASGKTTTPVVGQPQVSPQQGLDLLRTLREKGELLLAARPLSSDEHGNWKMLARNYLEKAFGANSPNVATVIEAGMYGSFPMAADEEWWEDNRASVLTTQVKRIEGLEELLRTEIQLSSGTPATASTPAVGHTIFLVHGHDEAVLQGTARFLQQLGQEFVILREQPNQGRTIIEKFEDFADVGFAVVLLTPDDIGGKAAESESALKPRARQNVILELGYFLGRLGRNRVCALYRDGVEIPSDYTGVLFVALDDRGAWKFELAKELRAAGFSIDMNNAL